MDSLCGAPNDALTSEDLRDKFSHSWQNNSPVARERYSLDSQELAFFRATTGIHDDERLREHVLEIADRAWPLAPYPCIRLLLFLHPSIPLHPVYPEILARGTSEPDAYFVDLGSFLGVELRKLAYDGYPEHLLLGIDVESRFFDLGRQLFRAHSNRDQISFIAGNIFDSSFFDSRITQSFPDPAGLSSLTSLTPLVGRVRCLHAGYLFHLFTLERQKLLAVTTLRLLSRRPGSILFGHDTCRPDGKSGKWYHGELLDSVAAERGVSSAFADASELKDPQNATLKSDLYCPEDWAKMWKEAAKEAGLEVRIAMEAQPKVTWTTVHVLRWSLTIV